MMMNQEVQGFKAKELLVGNAVFPWLPLFPVLAGLLAVICFALPASGAIPSTEDGSGAAGRAQVVPLLVVVDDYAAVSTPERPWNYTRIGTDRGEMGDGEYTVTAGAGQATVTVESGWAGVWTTLMHNAVLSHSLNSTQLLGPYVNAAYQPSITGVEVDVAEGSGVLKVELKDAGGGIVAEERFELSGGPRTVSMAVSAVASSLKELNWLVDGEGYAVVNEVRLVINSPQYTTAEAVFLFSYGHLSQCYDAATGLVGDRAPWPTGDLAAVQAMGMFALATAAGVDLGYIDAATGRSVIEKTRDTLTGLPTHHGLLPHFLTRGNITEGTEWSSIDTAITLVSGILACQAVGIDASPLEQMIRNVDWNGLTGNGTHSVSHGYEESGTMLSSTWDTFGSEAFVASLAYAAATGGGVAPLDNRGYPPTWDGSGFNDELATLFCPMTGVDAWGNDWSAYRAEAFRKQADYFSGHAYETFGLLGLSAGEVPEPWTVPESQVYSAWGVGGHNGSPNDGTSVAGYPVVAPHYAAMTAAEHPEALESVFGFLFRRNIFTPLNNVESLGLDGSGVLHWNALKGSWNLSLQALGAARALSKERGAAYTAYGALEENDFLKGAYNVLMEESSCRVGGFQAGRNVGVDVDPARCPVLTVLLSQQVSGDVGGKLYVGVKMPSVVEWTDLMWFRPSDELAPPYIRLAKDGNGFLPGVEDYFYLEDPAGGEDLSFQLGTGGLENQTVVFEASYLEENEAFSEENLKSLQRVEVRFNPK